MRQMILAKEEAVEADVESKSPIHDLPIEIEEVPETDAQKATSPIELENEIDKSAVDDDN